MLTLLFLRELNSISPSMSEIRALPKQLGMPGLVPSR